MTLIGVKLLLSVPCRPKLLYDLVYLLIHSVTHVTLDTRLQFIYYNTIYNIWTSTQYNIINNNTKFTDQLEVAFVTTSRCMCIYINVPKI